MRYEDLGTDLAGRIVRLEPLSLEHVEALAAASEPRGELYRWSLVPKGVEETRVYVERALQWRDSATSLPFVIIRQADDAVVGSTRLFDFERWSWPDAHPRHCKTDAAEIGYSWLAPQAVGTGANSEAKLMLLSAAFDGGDLLRICFHTDTRNERSHKALRSLGAEFEGFLRAHRLGADMTARTSARFSIVKSEWPRVRQQLVERLASHSRHR